MPTLLLADAAKTSHAAMAQTDYLAASRPRLLCADRGPGRFRIRRKKGPIPIFLLTPTEGGISTCPEPLCDRAVSRVHGGEEAQSRSQHNPARLGTQLSQTSVLCSSLKKQNTLRPDGNRLNTGKERSVRLTIPDLEVKHMATS